MLYCMRMSKKKLITEFTAHFENRKHNLAFNIQDGTGYVYLVADGLQLANVSKMLLLKGKGKAFEVSISEIIDNKQNLNESRKKKSRISRASADS